MRLAVLFVLIIHVLRPLVGISAFVPVLTYAGNRAGETILLTAADRCTCLPSARQRQLITSMGAGGPVGPGSIHGERTPASSPIRSC